MSDGGKVGKHATEPAVVYVKHPALGSLSLDCLLRLLFRADEQDRLVVDDRLANGVVRLSDRAYGLLKVDDVNPVALGKDELLHPGIPSLGLMTEMHT